MINVFYRNRNTIGQFMVALIFLGTFAFLFTYNGFAAKSEAKGCCGGGTPAVTTFAADSSGDFGSDILMDAEPAGGCCGGEGKVILSSSGNNGGDKCTCLSEYMTSCGSSCNAENKCSSAEDTVCGGSDCSPMKAKCKCDGKRCPNDSSSSCTVTCS